MAASGGYGDPYTRDPASVLEDVRQEKITLAHALREYGVVIIDAATATVDMTATAALRERRASERLESGGEPNQIEAGR